MGVGEGILNTLFSTLTANQPKRSGGDKKLYAKSDASKINFSLFGSDKLFISTVQEVFTHLGHHVVGKPGGSSKMAAFPVMIMGGNVMGTRSYTCYTPGTGVLCYDTGRGYALILGAVPTVNKDNHLGAMSDFITTGAECGYIHDAVHHQIAAMNAATKGGLINMSCGAPYDIIPGDFVAMNEFGVGYGIGKLFTYMRAGDSAKLEFFWLDYLVRMSAWNYEFFNSISEQRAFNDEGESHWTEFVALYPWEALGMKAKGEFTRQGQSDYKKGCREGYYEPKEDDQIGIFRHQKYRGFLGDLDREIIMVPEGITSPHTLTAEDRLPGVLEILKQVDGLYSVRSARGIILEKYNKIPVPKQMSLPDDNTEYSDSVDGDYKPSEAGDVKRTPWAYGEETPDIRAAQAWDYHSYMLNAAGLSTLANHTLDWYVPEESELPLGGKCIYDATKYGNLKTSFSLELPHVNALKVDDRAGEVDYYDSRSFIELHDDGSITIEDGYGSQIKMTGGNVFITAPGDIWQQPGRSAVTWAPHDVIMRAGNSADITAAKRDVRIKAEKNLHMLGGNSGTEGGVLIECRNEMPNSFNFEDTEGEDTLSTGIIFKAGKGPLYMYGKDVYIRAGADDPSDQDCLILDAGRGKSRLMMAGKDVFTLAKENMSIATGVDFENQDESAVHLMMQKNTFVVDGKELRNAVIAGSLSLVNPSKDGDCSLVVDGNTLINGNVSVNGPGLFEGVVFAKNLGQRANSPFVAGKVEYEVKNGIDKTLSDIKEQMGKFREQITDAYGNLGMIIYSDDRPGNDEFIEQLMFSLRNSEQYVTRELKLYQAAWQRLATKGGINETWDEPPVTGPKGDSYPHPGKEAWKDNQCFIKVEIGSAFDENAGCAKPRAGASNKGQAPQEQTLEGNYLIIVQEK